ncbi:MAG: hypothetical protein H7175_17670, partial [Burkholderiales bacterium]|nr:hypothetical protein [Anaerolineae bacterium]
ACTQDYTQPNCNVPITEGTIIAQEGNTGYSSNPHLHVEFGQGYGLALYPDLADDDGDGDRSEPVPTAFVYAEQNVGFRGYEPDDVAAWPYGTVEQASHDAPLPVGANLVRNGDFSAGTDAWMPSGQLSWEARDGVLYFLRLNSTEQDWGSFYQNLGYGAAAHTPFEITLQLGNTSAFQKYIAVSLRNSAGQQYGSVRCAFYVPAGAPLQPYTIRGVIPGTWANLRLEIAIDPPDSAPAAVVDDISVQHRPDLILTETECSEPQ